MTENQINVMVIEDDSTAAQIYEQFTKKIGAFHCCCDSRDLENRL